jgi:hypothetical protein
MVCSDAYDRIVLAEEFERIPDLLRRLLEHLIVEPVRLGQTCLALLHLNRDQHIINPHDMIRKLKLADLPNLKP